MTPFAMVGFGAALLTAFCQTATDIGTKAATREAEDRSILAAQWTAAAVVSSILCVISYPEFLHDPSAAFAALAKPEFAPVLFGAAALNLVAYYFFVRAFRLSDASLVAPLALVTPVLMLVTSPLIVNEHVSSIGGLGVALSAIGAATLGMTEPGASRRVSLRLFLSDRGVHSMLATALIWSVTGNLDKVGVRASTPLLWIASLSTLIALGAVGAWLAMPRRSPSLWSLRYAFAAGAANGVGNIVQMYALTLLFVPYVIAIKRASVLFTVMLGGALLREKTQGRLRGAAIMLLGAALMALGGE